MKNYSSIVWNTVSDNSSVYAISVERYSSATLLIIVQPIDPGFSDRKGPACGGFFAAYLTENSYDAMEYRIGYD